MAGVFAGGDIVTGAATVIEAMGAGRKAARSMKAYLGIARRRRRTRRPARAHAVRHRPRRAQFRARPHRCASQATQPPSCLHSRSNASTERRPSRANCHAARKKPAVTLSEHIVEIISDSGEGAQRCGQSLGAIAAQMGNGIWTVEIIPAEIRPPARSVAGASGNRIRIGSERVTNGGDETDLVVAFNEQVLLGRVRAGELKPGCDDPAREHVARAPRSAIVAAPTSRPTSSSSPPATACTRCRWSASAAALVADPRRGKNMFALGMLCSIYSLDLKLAREQIALTFGKKDAERRRDQRRAAGRRLRSGPKRNLDFKYRIPAERVDRAADRRQRQHGARARRARLGHGNLRDVSDHAGDVGVALPERGVREGRRHRAPGRGRDRRLRVRDRRVVRRQVRGHDHLRPGLLAQAGRRSASR